MVEGSSPALNRRVGDFKKGGWHIARGDGDNIDGIFHHQWHTKHHQVADRHGDDSQQKIMSKALAVVPEHVGLTAIVQKAHSKYAWFDRKRG